MAKRGKNKTGPNFSRHTKIPNLADNLAIIFQVQSHRMHSQSVFKTSLKTVNGKNGFNVCLTCTSNL